MLSKLSWRGCRSCMAVLDDRPSELTITLKEHPSTSDGKDHFTTVYRDADDNHITARHVYR